MDEKIVAAQRRILDNLVKCEAMIAELYETYAAMDAESAPFWSALAKEERSHSAMLESLKGLLDSGHVFWHIGNFDINAIAGEVAVIRTALDQARAERPSESERISSAVRIETSLLDSRFYEVVKSDAREFAYVSQALSKATSRHIRRLQERIAKSPRPSKSNHAGR